MSKPVVFISHINEEKDVALTFKNLVESNFLGMATLGMKIDDRCRSN